MPIIGEEAQCLLKLGWSNVKDFVRNTSMYEMNNFAQHHYDNLYMLSLSDVTPAICLSIRSAETVKMYKRKISCYKKYLLHVCTRVESLLRSFGATRETDVKIENLCVKMLLIYAPFITYESCTGL